jgi:quercetin dioxygenase-like cupin family protein
MKPTAVLICIAFASSVPLVAGRRVEAQPSQVSVTEIRKISLTEMPSKEARILELEIVPGGHVGWHYHPGDACAYVQQGSMVLVPRGKAAVTMKQDESGCVPPKLVHDDKNASQTEPVKFLVFFVADKGQPFAVPVK